MTGNTTITQDMLDAAGESIAAAFVQRDMQGLVFLEVTGGRIAIYNPTYKQALRQRFDNLPAARRWAIAHIMTKEVK